MVVDGLGRDEQPLGELGVGEPSPSSRRTSTWRFGQPGGVGAGRGPPAGGHGGDAAAPQILADLGGDRRRHRAGRAGRGRSGRGRRSSCRRGRGPARRVRRARPTPRRQPRSRRRAAAGTARRRRCRRSKPLRRVEPVQPRRQLAARPLQAGASGVLGEQSRHARRAGRRPAREPGPLDERGRGGQQPHRLAVPARPSATPRRGRRRRHRRRGARRGRGEVRPRPGERGARSRQHVVGVASASSQSPSISFSRPAGTELPDAADRQVALDRQRQAEAEQLGGVGEAAAARRRGR